MDRSIFRRWKSHKPYDETFYLDVLKKRHKKLGAIIVHKGSSSGIRVARLRQRTTWRRDEVSGPARRFWPSQPNLPVQPQLANPMYRAM
jgi:hypothetical protein